MRILTTVLFFITIACFSAAGDSALLKGRIINQSSGEGIAYAEVQLADTSLGTACDEDGFFQLQLPPGEYRLRISALGYRSAIYNVNAQSPRLSLEIPLREQPLSIVRQVNVYGTSVAETARPQKLMNRTVDVLSSLGGVNLIRRGSFGQEPVIRGMSGERIGLVVDDMKIFSACVDHMDPVSSYVEPENLEQVEVAGGGSDLLAGAAIGGTANLVTQGAGFSRSSGLDLEAGYETAASTRRVRGVINRVVTPELALRASFSARMATDFQAGRQHLIGNSGYKKANAKADLAWRSGENRIRMSYIGDLAVDMEFPVLLMDATRAVAHMGSLDYVRYPANGAGQNIHSKLYFSHVDHWMDDYNRDVSDREVMRGMNMPMYGKSRTIGVIQEGRFRITRHLLHLKADYYYLQAFADMDMVPLDEAATSSYLLNLADVRKHHLAGIADYRWIGGQKLLLRSQLRLDAASQTIGNELGMRQLGAASGSDNFRRRKTGISINGGLEYRPRPKTYFSLQLASVQRLPGHVEQYGFFLYNPLDGYFYNGNPDLLPERSNQLELRFAGEARGASLEVSSFYYTIDNYIAGVLTSGEFKSYTNIPSARIGGVELDSRYRLSRELAFNTSIVYTHGENVSRNEPLPLIPPLQGDAAIYLGQGDRQLSLEYRWARSQNRIARKSSGEDSTPGFGIWNLRVQYPLNPTVSLQFGGENLLDSYYHEHLSIKNLKSPGRNIYLALILRR